MQPGLMPGLPPGTQLSLPDAVRLRDRATILARQLYAAPDGAGPAMADQQVHTNRHYANKASSVRGLQQVVIARLSTGS
jgi:hypothetical protein